MKRNAAILGVSAIALSVAAIPVGAAVMHDGPAQTSAVVAEVPSENLQALDQAGTYSDATLMGTGAAFLLLGIATVNLAHRRRWHTIDLRDNADVLDAVPRKRAQYSGR
jgi:hypothetical protein